MERVASRRSPSRPANPPNDNAAVAELAALALQESPALTAIPARTASQVLQANPALTPLPDTSRDPNNGASTARTPRPAPRAPLVQRDQKATPELQARTPTAALAVLLAPLDLRVHPVRLEPQDRKDTPVPLASRPNSPARPALLDPPVPLDSQDPMDSLDTPAMPAHLARPVHLETLAMLALPENPEFRDRRDQPASAEAPDPATTAHRRARPQVIRLSHKEEEKLHDQVDVLFVLVAVLALFTLFGPRSNRSVVVSFSSFLRFPFSIRSKSTLNYAVGLFFKFPCTP